MPPRVQNVDWSSWETFRAQNPRVQKTPWAGEERVYGAPLWHGGMKVAPEGRLLEVLSADGERVLRFDIVQKRELAPKAADLGQAESFFPKKQEWEARHPRGRYLISNREELYLFSNPNAELNAKSSNSEQWRHRFLLSLDDVLFVPGSSDLLGFRRYPAHLFYLGWGQGRYGNRSTIFTYRWDKDAEILSVHPCGAREVLVVENLKNGLLRASSFEMRGTEGLQFKRYLLHAWPPDPSGRSEHPEVTRFLALNECRTLVVGGSNGIWKGYWQ
jgi:hypothetical protein